MSRRGPAAQPVKHECRQWRRIKWQLSRRGKWINYQLNRTSRNGITSIRQWNRTQAVEYRRIKKRLNRTSRQWTRTNRQWFRTSRLWKRTS
jgi:hypothetical protein